MAASEENSALFPIFILTIMALPLIPYTIMKLCRAASRKARSIHCQCSVCTRSGKYRRSIFKRISKFSTCSNLTLVLLWVTMAVLVYYIKHISREEFSRLLVFLLVAFFAYLLCRLLPSLVLHGKDKVFLTTELFKEAWKDFLMTLSFHL